MFKKMLTAAAAIAILTTAVPANAGGNDGVVVVAAGLLGYIFGESVASRNLPPPCLYRTAEGRCYHIETYLGHDPSGNEVWVHQPVFDDVSAPPPVYDEYHGYYSPEYNRGWHHWSRWVPSPCRGFGGNAVSGNGQPVCN